ncbi:zinc finger [Paramuricea clavata]|uniref:Zinc finger n=1 Tax=Paramuricea clavata TaxID=317549 RepID=A0A6S7GRE9_PARCT|nr:zinc finger [Paramuricea clavata]
MKNGKIAATVHKVSLTADIIKKLYEKRELHDVDTQSPRASLQTAWFQISIYFGKRGRENQSSLKKSMLCLVKTADSHKYFKLNRGEPGTVLTSKNHTGAMVVSRKNIGKVLDWEQINIAFGDTDPHLLLLVDLLLTIPAHSAECERGFSLVKLVKSDWTNSLTDEAYNLSAVRNKKKTEKVSAIVHHLQYAVSASESGEDLVLEEIGKSSDQQSGSDTI